MAPIPDDKGGLKGYEYRVPGIAPVPLNAQDVLKFRLYDPLDMYGGQAPVSVAARSGYIDNSTTDFVKQLLEEGAVPPGIITSKQKLIEQQVEDIRRRWQNRYGGFRNWKAPAILDSEATYQRTGMTLTEMGFEVLDERSESRICSVLKVPTILVGTKIGLGRSTFSNYAEARKTFWQDGLMPQYKRIRDELQRDLGPEYDGNAVLAWDFSDVPGLMEDQNTRWERATRALAAGGITVNMFLEEIGKDPVGTDGEVFLRGLNQQAVPLKRPATTGKILPFEGKGAVADNAPDDSLRRKHEHGMQRELSTFFDEQMARVREALANVA
jgi:HK97 family phage portal protein